ncbi:MAG: Ig-like domain-containing protein [Planctomycetota bacterium]
MSRRTDWRPGGAVIITIGILLTTCAFGLAASGPAGEQQTGRKQPKWPEGVTKEVMVSLSNFETGKFEFDRYLPVVEYKGHWRPDLRYVPGLQEEHVHQYSFRFVDANDMVPYEFPFTVDFKHEYRMAEAHGQIVDEANYPICFLEWLPFPEKTRKLVFMEGHTLLAEKVRSEHQPVLTLGSAKVQADHKLRIPWSVSDADDRELLLNLKFIDVDGEHLLANNLKLVLEPEPHTDGHVEDEGFAVGCGSPRVLAKFLEFDSRPFQGGEKCQLLVELSDGLNSTVVSSEPFKIALHIPDVVILAPKNGQTFRENEEVSFFVSLRDPGGVTYAYVDEQGVFQWKGNYQIQWVSDKDGQFGEGCSLRAAGLSAGEHTITVLVKGLAETAGRDSVRVKVLPAVFPEYWISADDIALTVDYYKPNWPTFLCAKARGNNVLGEPPFVLVVKYKGHKDQYSFPAGLGRDAGKDPTIVVDGRVPWPFTEPGDYEAEVTLRWTEEPSLRQRDNTVIKRFHWEGPADRHIPVNDFPDIRVIPGSLVIEPAEVPAGERQAKCHWRVEVRNSRGQRMGHDIYIGDMRVHSQTSPSNPCHVERVPCNNTCWLPKEVGTYSITVRVKIDGEPETMLGDNDLKGQIRIVPRPSR